jgi:alpha-2-macroglobulin
MPAAHASSASLLRARRFALCALVCALFVLVFHGDVAAAEEARPRPGGPATAGERFDAPDPQLDGARARAARAARDARWRSLEKSLRRADASTLWARGEEQEKSQNWKDAQDAYLGLVVQHPRHKNAPLAIERAARMAFRRAEYGEGFQLFEDALYLFESSADRLVRARLLRVLSALTLAVPHWGTTRGGQYLRGRYEQGRPTQTYAEDRQKAEALLEEARDLLEAAGAPGRERAAVDVDLALAVARFTAFDATWSWWWSPTSGPSDGLVDAEGEDERADPLGSDWSAPLARARPRGLPVSPGGEVLFASRPARYHPALSDTEKIKFLLHEAQQLDDDPNREIAAQALLQQALLFRTRDGAERLERLRAWWWQGTHPYADIARDDELQSLADDEVLTLVATSVRRVKVPDDESVPRLLAEVQRLYPKASAAAEAPVLLGAFFQSREQYPKAIEAYERAGSAKTGGFQPQAREGIAQIVRPEASFEGHGSQPAGRSAQIVVQHRNLDDLQLRATRIDAELLLRDFEQAWKDGEGRPSKGETIDPAQLGWPFVHRGHEGNEARVKRYLTKEVLTFGAALERDPSHRLRTARIDTPLTRAGVWLLEAFGGGARDALARTIVVIDGAALVMKSTAQGQIAWVVDGASGKPVSGAQIDVFLYASDWRKGREVRRSQKHTLRTDGRGVALLPKSADMSALVSARVDGTLTLPVQLWLGDGYARGGRTADEVLGVLVTDRPVYRPGDTVRGQLWARKKKGGAFVPAQDVKRMRLRVHDSRGIEVLVKEEAASAWGSLAFELPLPKGAALGAWRIQMLVDGQRADVGRAGFRVEEYKAPEVRVEVKAAGQARLGELVPVSIAASYYSGGPVAGAAVRYKIFRVEHELVYAAPTPWDWLYGRGFGRIFYPYPWFGWHDDQVARPLLWYPWWGPRPEPPRELVLEGEGVLDAKGSLSVKVETAAAKRELSDADHRYVIEAEVTDLSRRVVKGSGSVIATRTPFLASIEVAAGWARAGDDVQLAIATLLPDGAPLPARGSLQIDEILGVTEAGVVRGEKRIEERPITTDIHGPTRVRWRAPKTGQFRFTFAAKAKDGSTVTASAVAWVVGPDFVGSRYRFAGVEVIPDRRTYAPGETARLLVSADRAGSSVLFATRIEDGRWLDWQLLELPEKTAVVEVPIGKHHSPNFFVEAIAVTDGQLLNEAREIFVPPQQSELNVRVTPARSELRPGERTEVTVTTTDGQGRPVAAEVALSVFDAAVLAIAPDTTADARMHLWGRKRWHHPSATTSLARPQPVWGTQTAPQRLARWLLAHRSQRRFQSQVDFVHGEDLGDADDSTLSFSGALGARGEGAGGGGRTSMMKAAVGMAEASAPAEPAAQTAPAGQSAEAEREPAERRFDPQVRSAFADTAFFRPSILTGPSGKATVTVSLPENLTTWAVRAVGLDGVARAGRGDAEMVTTKKLLVRLAAPRFFREKDALVLSAIVQNKHAQRKSVEVSLDVTEAFLTPTGPRKINVDVPPAGEARVDFPVSVRGEGEAKVRVTARAKDDGDAKELSFPVLVHGMEKTVARTGSISAAKNPGALAEKSVTVVVPGERREEQTRLVVRTSPSLAGGMIDALPYLLEYPYGCVEQTLSRFVPAVLTRRALQQAGGVRLEDLEGARRSLNPQRLAGPDQAPGELDRERLGREHRRFDRNPIYDSKLLEEIIAVGLARLATMQNADGGWGWWGDDGSSAYMTAHVLAGLLDARDADLPLDGGMLERGRAALRALVESERWRYREKGGDRFVSDTDAYALWVMSRFGDRHEELERLLFQRRIHLSPYGKLLLSLAHARLGDASKAKLLLDNVEQLRKADRENETSWIATATTGWWHWWNDDIETNALYLRALDVIRPGDAVAPQVVKWLLNNRKNGWYWDSTKDTAVVVAAFANHMQVSGERHADYELEILLDGVVKKGVRVTPTNLFSVDADLVLEGEALSAGEHTITVRRRGDGAVYFNTYLSFFTLEDDIKAEGLEVKVDRRYFKLERADRTRMVGGARGQDVAQPELAWRKVPLSSGAQVKSGDLILVELLVTSKNHYSYLAFEDPKPAGAEAVAVRSGQVIGETHAHLELRDDRVAFFLSELSQGTLTLSYRLRAELPGTFSAMPARAFAMYAPEIRANSDEMKLRIVE